MKHKISKLGKVPKNKRKQKTETNSEQKYENKTKDEQNKRRAKISKDKNHFIEAPCLTKRNTWRIV